MRRVGIRTFKDTTTTLLKTQETLVVERHGTPIGVYIPLAAKDRAVRARSLADLGAYLQTFLTTHGLTEEEVARALSTPESDERTDAAQ
jgi:hypothetical protein